jgi:hypothetical protein
MPSPRLLLRNLQDRPDAIRTLALLQDLARVTMNAQDLQKYHEQLLFYKAYPRSPELRAFCEQELSRFAQRVRKLGKSERLDLLQSGIAGSLICYPYDEPMAKWLLDQLGNHVDVDWEGYAEKDDDPIGGCLSLLMEPAEQDAVDARDLSARDIIDAARGDQTALAWLLERFRTALPDRNVRAEIYNPMQIPLAVKLTPEGPSRTRLDDGAPNQLFLWDPAAARAGFDLVRETRRPLRIPRPVSRKRAQEILDLVYGSLLTRYRELYPATHCNLDEVYDIRLERGIRVLFFFMQPEYRLPLEAGWGCLLLKNNVPIGYGAGGMVAEQSEISINIFDTFRGGEAAWLYAQYARICYQWCRAPWLVTRKWQLGGEGNDEGIESGSFWFYDKLGFRSVDPRLRRLADSERKKIAARKGYRCPESVLRKLAEADVVFSLQGRPASEYREFPAGAAGLAATGVIAKQFGGKRRGLQARVLQEMRQRFKLSYAGWSRDEKARFAQMSLFVLALPKVESWSAGDRRKLFAMCRAKGSSHEADYVRGMPENLKFFSALRKLSEK